MKKLHLVFGPQGSGKSTYAKQLATQVTGVHFAIDDWMWQLYGPDLPEPMNFAWIMERVARCEQQIWATAKQVLANGGAVVLDLGFMKQADRERYKKLAGEANLPVQLHYVHAGYEIRRSRVLDRNQQKGETFSFDVSPAMFDAMEKQFEAPNELEQSEAVIIDTNY